MDMNSPAATAVDLSSLYRIRETTTQRGVIGYAIFAWNDHSQTWQPIGAIHTGPGGWVAVNESRRELLEDLANEGARP